MMSAFTSSRDCVTMGDVATSIDELQWVEFSVRQQQQAARVAASQAAAGMTGAGGFHGASGDAHGTTATGVMGVPPASNGNTTETGSAVGRLLIATDGRTVQEIPLKVGRLIVGRTTDNDIQIDSRFVSRHHCQVITTPHACVIEDLNSTNGIYVKSKRVRRHYLNDGDVVQLGKHELIYIDERLPRIRAPFTETVPGGLPPEPIGETH
jgi:general secretion pathway protein A